jgi:hypothetical protein
MDGADARDGRQKSRCVSPHESTLHQALDDSPYPRSVQDVEAMLGRKQREFVDTVVGFDPVQNRPIA